MLFCLIGKAISEGVTGIRVKFKCDFRSKPEIQAIEGYLSRREFLCVFFLTLKMIPTVALEGILGVRTRSDLFRVTLSKGMRELHFFNIFENFLLSVSNGS